MRLLCCIHLCDLEDQSNLKISNKISKNKGMTDLYSFSEDVVGAIFYLTNAEQQILLL